MIDEARKPTLREIWRTHKPSEWHRLVGSLITRQEWEYLCTQYQMTKKKTERPIINPSGFTATPNVADDDIKRLEQELG